MRKRGRWMNLADGTDVGMTTHAITRYQERVTPGLELLAAQQHMVRLTGQIGAYGARPGWLEHDTRKGTRFVLLGPDVVLLVVDEDVVTVVARGGLTPLAQQRRRERRQARRARALSDRHPKIVRAEARTRRREARAPRADEDAA